MVEQPTVKASIAILERMHIHETEAYRRGCDDWI